MPLAVTAVALVILLAFPLAGRSRGVHACLGLAALAWLLSLALVVLGSDFLLSVFDFFNEPALHDTYYVVGHVHYRLVVVGLMALLALGAWVARPLPRLSTLSFWTGHLALVASYLGPELIPIDVRQDAAAPILTRMLGVLAALAFLVLAVQIVLRLSARARGSH